MMGFPDAAVTSDVSGDKLQMADSSIRCWAFSVRCSAFSLCCLTVAAAPSPQHDLQDRLPHRCQQSSRKRDAFANTRDVHSLRSGQAVPYPEKPAASKFTSSCAGGFL